MKSPAICASIGHALPIFCVVACASSSSPTTVGVTNEQPEGVREGYGPTNPQTDAVRNVTSPDRCQPRGTSCQTARDCCTGWCDDGFCTLRSVR
jgi:hypothetical protein